MDLTRGQIFADVESLKIPLFIPSLEVAQVLDGLAQFFFLLLIDFSTVATVSGPVDYFKAYTWVSCLVWKDSGVWTSEFM